MEALFSLQLDQMNAASHEQYEPALHTYTVCIKAIHGCLNKICFHLKWSGSGLNSFTFNVYFCSSIYRSLSIRPSVELFAQVSL